MKDVFEALKIVRCLHFKVFKSKFLKVSRHPEVEEFFYS